MSNCGKPGCYGPNSTGYCGTTGCTTGRIDSLPNIENLLDDVKDMVDSQEDSVMDLLDQFATLLGISCMISETIDQESFTFFDEQKLQIIFNIVIKKLNKTSNEIIERHEKDE